jgi:hypothetical protein
MGFKMLSTQKRDGQGEPTTFVSIVASLEVGGWKSLEVLVVDSLSCWGKRVKLTYEFYR